MYNVCNANLRYGFPDIILIQCALEKAEFVLYIINLCSNYFEIIYITSYADISILPTSGITKNKT